MSAINWGKRHSEVVQRQPSEIQLVIGGRDGPNEAFDTAYGGAGPRNAGAHFAAWLLGTYGRMSEPGERITIPPLEEMERAMQAMTAAELERGREIVRDGLSFGNIRAVRMSRNKEKAALDGPRGAGAAFRPPTVGADRVRIARKQADAPPPTRTPARAKSELRSRLTQIVTRNAATLQAGRPSDKFGSELLGAVDPELLAQALRAFPSGDAFRAAVVEIMGHGGVGWLRAEGLADGFVDAVQKHIISAFGGDDLRKELATQVDVGSSMLRALANDRSARDCLRGLLARLEPAQAEAYLLANGLGEIELDEVLAADGEKALLRTTRELLATVDDLRVRIENPSYRLPITALLPEVTRDVVDWQGLGLRPDAEATDALGDLFLAEVDRTDRSEDGMILTACMLAASACTGGLAAGVATAAYGYLQGHAASEQIATLYRANLATASQVEAAETAALVGAAINVVSGFLPLPKLSTADDVMALFRLSGLSAQSIIDAGALALASSRGSDITRALAEQVAPEATIQTPEEAWPLFAAYIARVGKKALERRGELAAFQRAHRRAFPSGEPLFEVMLDRYLAIFGTRIPQLVARGQARARFEELLNMVTSVQEALQRG